MKRTIIMICIAAAAAVSCTVRSVQEGWVKVEGN